MLKVYIETWEKIGLKKYAHVLPDNIIGVITTEQLEKIFKFSKLKDLKTMVTTDLESAKAWIYEEI